LLLMASLLVLNDWLFCQLRYLVLCVVSVVRISFASGGVLPLPLSGVTFIIAHHSFLFIHVGLAAFVFINSHLSLKVYK